jgi:hypothetical protein
MWPSLPIANLVADVANILLIGSLAVGVVSTATIVWMTRVKESYWEADRMTSAERIAEIRTEAELARAGITDSNAKAAAAQERAAKAELELAKLKAPRHLTEEQGARLITTLKQFSGTAIFLGAPPGDVEALALTAQLSSPY